LRKLICSRCIAVLGFQLPGLRPYLKVGGRFHPLYRGTWFPTTESGTVIRLTRWGFPSAMSRYLVSNLRMCRASKLASRFHPLYRGTWFPTLKNLKGVKYREKVSIRYIAVLGFQRGAYVFIGLH